MGNPVPLQTVKTNQIPLKEYKGNTARSGASYLNLNLSSKVWFYLQTLNKLFSLPVPQYIKKAIYLIWKSECICTPIWWFILQVLTTVKGRTVQSQKQELSQGFPHMADPLTRTVISVPEAVLVESCKHSGVGGGSSKQHLTHFAKFSPWQFLTGEWEEENRAVS